LADVQALRFVDWHPQRPEMLVLARGGGATQLHRLRAAGAAPERLTDGRDGVGTARWEPEQGRHLVFSRDRQGDEAWQLYLWRDGEPAQRISAATGRVTDFEFLPRGAGLVYLWEQLDRHAQGERQGHSQLIWVDPLAPERRRVLGEVKDGRFGALRVAASGAVLLTRTQAGRTQWLSFALEGSAPKALGEAERVDVSEVGDGGDSGDSGDTEEMIWGRQAVKGEFRHLTSLGSQSGERQHLLTTLEADLEALAAPAPGSGLPLALVHNEQGLSVLRFYDAASGELQPAKAALRPGLVRNPRWHPRLPLLAFDQVSARHPGRVWVYDHASHGVSAWSGTEVQGGPEFAALRWKSFDGLEISGLHLAPPARFTGKRPVYINIHGGPSAQARPSFLSGTLRHLVEELGMHVILPNVRGSDGLGKRFLALDNGLRREDAVKDISALLDLIGSRADMDAAKVVVAGGSYGGYMALAVAAHESARIAGSICRVGISNFVSFLENTESYRRNNRRAEYGDERIPAMRQFLLKISPLNQADKVKKPLFVVHGRNDPRVPWSEAQAMVGAVRGAGTPVWFLTAEDEGHSFTRADNRDYLHQATLEFVQRLLEGRALN
ncbi:MAG: prolyl oligopeptidase family serine peptidase, partial [Rubrivivax sp.]|nr:prolyl oligopeptidase family serine peptidase [Rubrivivax sp.]